MTIMFLIEHPTNGRDDFAGILLLLLKENAAKFILHSLKHYMFCPSFYELEPVFLLF